MLGVDPSTIRRWERADNDPQPWHRPMLAQALRVSLDELALLLDEREIGRDLAIQAIDGQDEDVDRRSFWPLVALPALGGLGTIVELLTPAGQITPLDRELTMAEARQLATRAKRLYQGCRYQQALQIAPIVIEGLDTLALQAIGEQRADVQRQLADTYHVIASILLKLDGRVLATLAAQRSMDAASLAADPIAAACSARIMSHALMKAGHGDRAISLAVAFGTALRKSPSGNTSAGLSAFGALALRAATAAARADQRQTAMELLNEADAAAIQLGHDANDRWTGFGPTNVQLHKVNVALTLGDAGTALARAERIDLAHVKLPERRASFLSDVAQAHLARGKAAEALVALEQAYAVAPEEIASRPQGRRTYQAIVARARGPVRDRAFRFAMRAGLANG